jgi:signal transduction histidine kinase
MVQSTDRLARTIDNLADFAVLDSRTYPIRAEPVELVKMSEHLIEEAQLAIAKPKHVHISLMSPSEPVTIHADPARLSQALGNLIENAVKFSPHGGEVLVEVRQTDGTVQVAIYDQGEGVAPEDQTMIFEPFHHVKGARHVATSGLGLPVARKIAEAHGGKLTVESPPKVQPDIDRAFTGAKFVLDLPAMPRA